MLFDGRRWKGVAAVMEGGASQANPTLMAALTCKPANKPPNPVITASAVLLRPSGDQTQLQTRRDEATSFERALWRLRGSRITTGECFQRAKWADRRETAGVKSEGDEERQRPE